MSGKDDRFLYLVAGITGVSFLAFFVLMFWVLR
jgi:hypothetical protein